MKKSIIVLAVLAVFMVSCVSAPKEVPPINLHAIDADLITESQLVYEAQEGRECVGWWTQPEDEIHWDFDIVVKGEYTIIATVACDAEFAGSKIGVSVGGQDLEFVMPDTYDWDTYYQVEVGVVRLAPGSYTIVVKGNELMNRFYGNLQSLILKKTG